MSSTYLECIFLWTKLKNEPPFEYGKKHTNLTILRKLFLALISLLVFLLHENNHSQYHLDNYFQSLNSSITNYS